LVVNKIIKRHTVGANEPLAPRGEELSETKGSTWRISDSRDNFGRNLKLKESDEPEMAGFDESQAREVGMVGNMGFVLRLPVPLGRLKNGNRSGDPTKAPRCGARSRRRGGKPCRAPAVRGKRRCRMHGGASTGPRTPEGLARSRRAHWIHGRESREAREARTAERWARQPTEAEKQAMMRRWAREHERAARRDVAEFRAAMRRLGL
jgi:hypothetical protein